MPISAGTRLGPYEIVAPIGAGGMGEVYKARDTRLDRTVAVKVLPAEFASNAQFKVRFEREAKTISQLSHPNICALYDVGDNYLVMELLDGETLADRLTKGALPPADVFKFGVQIAEALGKAHREGVIHRDLKPGNVMLTKSGAKLLDFGLAKSNRVVESDKTVTQEGTIVGTIQYMAPEQLAGEEPDARSDIFALGAVLYEMTTGKRAFEGKTRTSVVSAIMASEPRPVAEVQPLTPPALDHIIRKCLAKDREDRWQSALDIAEELRWVAEERPASRVRRTAIWPFVGAAALLALAIGAVVGAWFVARRHASTPTIFSTIEPPEGGTFAFDAATATLSPNGEMIAMVARSSIGLAIWIRRLDSPTAFMLRGTDNPSFPFWSPDSKWLGFFADGKLKKIEVNSGSSETIADAGTGRGGTWSPDGTILFTPTPGSPIYAVSANGGDVRQVTELDINRGDTSHRFATFLPDGRHFLFYVQGAAERNIFVGSLDSKETLPITTAQAGVAFAPPDYILFVRDGVLRAQHLDLKTFKVFGDSAPIGEHIQVSGSLNFANVSVSANGLLAFVTGGSATLSTLTMVDHQGKELNVIGGTMEQLDVALAPDGHAAAISRYTVGGFSDVWVCDLKRDVQTRQTFSPANEFGAVWSPDSKSIVFTSFDKRPGDLLVKRVDTSGPGDVLFADRRRKIPTSWSPDGNYVLLQALTPGSQWDIEAYSIRDHKVIPVVKTTAVELHGQISPDGKWLAYSSTEPGRMEVFVRQFLGGVDHWQVSGGGGSMPRWSRDGRTLYYVASDGKLMATTVHAEKTFSADAPQPLFPSRLRLVNGITRLQYDVTADGRFLMNIASAETEHQSLITIVQNWERKIPAQ
jgi:serine/threonine protein kinase